MRNKIRNQILTIPINPKNTYFKFLLFALISIIFICICIYFYIYYSQYKKELISQRLTNSYNLQHIYSNNSNYNYNLELPKNTIIGSIEIHKLNIKYTIFYGISDELLKLSTCRFYGCMPNEIGNLCIAGHNYNNNKFFSKLNTLQNNDIISIYDLSGNKLNYLVYKKYEISSNDTSCTSQKTNNLRYITLITCNNINGNRLVIKALEKNKNEI